jgi:pimeloyl-ACP methyl ester carboxylesterase
VSRHGHSRLRVLEDSGHVCNVDQADLFNRLAIDFMKRGLAAQPGAA